MYVGIRVEGCDICTLTYSRMSHLCPSSRGQLFTGYMEYEQGLGTSENPICKSSEASSKKVILTEVQ